MSDFINGWPLENGATGNNKLCCLTAPVKKILIEEECQLDIQYNSSFLSFFVFYWSALLDRYEESHAISAAATFVPFWLVPYGHRCNFGKICAKVNKSDR